MAGGIEKWGNDLYTGAKSYDIVGRRKVFYIVSGVLVALSIVSMLVFGFNLGIDFRGGSEFQVSGAAQTSQQTAIDAVRSVVPEAEPLVSEVGDDSVRIQMETLSDDQQATRVREALATAYDVEASEVTSTVIGPTWGRDVSIKALQGLVVFLAVAAVFMTVYFRNWRMAVSGIAALFHDLIVTVGVYAAIGWEVTPASMIGFLTILGYSMYDTVVVFDKVRENTTGIEEQHRFTYGELANLALNQTLVRSINTSVVGLLPVASILFVGALLMRAGTLRDIALALFVGMLVGTYSSIFLATPLDVSLTNRRKGTREHDAAVAEARARRLEGSPEEPVTERVGELLPGTRLSNAAQPRNPKRRR